MNEEDLSPDIRKEGSTTLDENKLSEIIQSRTRSIRLSKRDAKLEKIEDQMRQEVDEEEKLSEEKDKFTGLSKG